MSRFYIKKPDKPAYHKELDDFLARQTGTIDSLNKDFQRHVDTIVDMVREAIDSTPAYTWQVQSLATHLRRTIERMASGEIKGLTEDGGFKL